MLEGFLLPVTLAERAGHQDRWHVRSGDLSATEPAVDHTREYLPISSQNEEHYCMPAAKTTTKQGGGDTLIRRFLLEVVDAKSGTVQRLGMAFFSPDQYAQMRTTPGAEPNGPCVNYDAITGRHQIRIV